MTAVQTVPALLRFLRLLPSGMRGKERIVRWITRRMLHGGPADICANGLTFRVPSTREPVARHLIGDGTYEPDVCAALASWLRPSSTFFDVGANVGVMSLFAAHRWCQHGRVVSFEASPKIFACLDHNDRTNPHPSLQVLNRAVTSQSGQQLTFFDAPDEKFGMGSLTNRFNTTGVEVPTITLDDAASELGIEQVDVIKVDVEGFELGVFQGAQRLLQQSQAPFIVFEFNDWAEDNGTTKPGDAQRFLRDLGYTTLPLDRWQRGELKLEPVIVSGGENIVAFKPSIQ